MQLGIPILGQREFLSKVLIIGTSGTGTLELMQCLHENARPFEREDLSVDESMEGGAVYHFDVRISTAQVKTEYGPFSLRLTVMGMEGQENRWFDLLSRRTPEIVIVASGADEGAWRGVEGLIQRLRGEDERALHLLLVESNSGEPPPLREGSFASVHRVKGLRDPACWNVILAVGADIARQSHSPPTR